MQGGDLDTYNAQFNSLSAMASFKPNKKGTIELYKTGLNQKLLTAIIEHRQKDLNTLDEWQEEAAKQQLQWIETRNAQGGGLTPQQQRWAHALNLWDYTPRRNSHRSRDQSDKMDIDAIRFQPLTDQEKDELRKQGACFRCRKIGHNAKYC